MPTLESKDRPFEDVEHVGLVLTSNTLGLHCAFIYKTDEGEARTLGLAFHHLLEDDVADTKYRWGQIGLDKDNKEILMNLLIKIKHRKPEVPYAFNPEGVVFNETTGDLLPPPAGHGLTCATFIVAALRTYGFELVDLATWSDKPINEGQLRVILRYLRQHAGNEHCLAIQTNDGAKALSPDEVISSGSLHDSNWPVNFRTARDIADEVIADLGS